MKTKPAFIVDPGPSRAHANRRSGSVARVLAVLLLGLILTWGLFGKAFRFGENCGITVGEPAPLGQARELCDWFAVQ